MSQWITEEQTPHLRLSAEAEEVLYSGESEFQKIEVFKSKEYGMITVIAPEFQGFCLSETPKIIKMWEIFWKHA